MQATPALSPAVASRSISSAVMPTALPVLAMDAPALTVRAAAPASRMIVEAVVVTLLAAVMPALATALSPAKVEAAPRKEI